MDCSTNVPTYHRSHSGTFSRTYAEFSSLHAALSANHPETILPALPLPQTSATSEEEEDRFLKGIFQRFMDRITKDKALILDDELRGFVEADFGVRLPSRRGNGCTRLLLTNVMLTHVHSIHHSPARRS